MDRMYQLRVGLQIQVQNIDQSWVYKYTIFCFFPPALAAMYAIETKKRKFDRILETIKDHGAARPTPQTPAHNNTSTISFVETISAKKRRLDPSAISMTSKNSSVVSIPQTANYLPSSRESFLERLETFGPITKWHIPSTEKINAAAWAKRGWWCTDADMVACKACGEQTLVKLDGDEAKESASSDSKDEEEKDDINATDILRHGLLVDKYNDMIITSHAESCPWRNRGCDESIQRISGLLNTTSAIQHLKTRYDSLEEIDIPSVYLSPEFPHATDGMMQFRFTATKPESLQQDGLRLTMCGWQASPGREDVVECRACFRSLGLWLHRGEQPIMEKLDAVESHLEYCPWRSAKAQRTEIQMNGKKEMVPAWMLVARAMKEMVDHPPGNGVQEMQHEEQEPVGEKERENKVKELLRRVKDLRKPFNVRALLRKKPTTG